MQRLAPVLAVLAVCLLSACAALQPRPPAPSPAQVVEWSRQKLAPETIIARMREVDAVYRLTASELVRLHEQGVADPVLDYMQGSMLRDVQRQASERYHYSYSPWPRGYIPGTPGAGYGPYPWGF